MQRLSNNRFPKFTDEECITAFLWGKLEGRLTRRDVYTFIRDYWHDWFPKLPSYQAFCRRLNNLSPAFQALAEVWSRKCCTQFEDAVQYIIDSCPIILAKQARAGSAKVAREFCDKSYNSSRKEYYYGVKLHAIVIRRPGKIPVAETLMLSRASIFDLTAAKEIMCSAPLSHGGILLADKAYIDSTWETVLQNENSTSVSMLRQPIESFFNWLESHFHIQRASNVRSAAGLLSHVFASLAAAMFFQLFNY